MRLRGKILIIPLIGIYLNTKLNQNSQKTNLIWNQKNVHLLTRLCVDFVSGTTRVIDLLVDWCWPKISDAAFNCTWETWTVWYYHVTDSSLKHYKPPQKTTFEFQTWKLLISIIYLYMVNVCATQLANCKREINLSNLINSITCYYTII